MWCGAGRGGSVIKYGSLLDALSFHLKQMHWDEASGLRQAPAIPTQPSAPMPASPTASHMYAVPGYQSHPQQYMFQPPVPGQWQPHPAGFPQNSGAAAAPELADQEPFPYFMQACSSPTFHFHP